MSHFTVTVRIPAEVELDQVEEHVERLLAPYQENNMGDCPEEYLEFRDYGEELRPKYESGEETVRRFRDPEGSYHRPYQGQFKVDDKSRPRGFRYQAPEGWEDDRFPVKDVYPDFDTFMQEEEDMEPNENGKYGWMHNPNHKWDWWLIGGRWTGYYPVTPDVLQRGEATSGEPGLMTEHAEAGHVDMCRIKDIDMGTIEEQINSAIENFWRETADYIEKGSAQPFGVRGSLLSLGFVQCKDEDELTDEDRAKTLIKWKKELREGVSRYDVVDHTILDRKDELRGRLRAYFNSLRTYAFLDEEHGWVQPGEMGWFGASSDTPETMANYSEKFQEWFFGGNEADWVVVVDCHI